MPIGYIELILFAAQAGVKLIQTGRKVYVEATIGGEVEVPLPPTFPNTPRNMALNYAQSLQVGGDQDKRKFADSYKVVISKLEAADPSVSAEAEWLLIQQYLADMAHGVVPSFNRSQAELASIAVIKQWERGQAPFPSAVQRIAGSLVEVAIDYFLQVPGALNENSRQGKAVKSFLHGLADFDFQDARWDSIAIALFTTALDTLTDHPGIIAHEAVDQSLIRKIVGGVSSDVIDKLKGVGPGDLDAESRLERFGQIVLRSLLKNGGTAIIESPSLLGIEKGGQALVQSVGSAFLDILLGDGDATLTDGLRQIASTNGLDKLIRAALKAAVEHPDLFGTGNQAVDVWLKGVLADLYNRRGQGQTFFDPELFVDVAYSALDNGLRDLPLLLKSPGSTPALLIDVARQAFDVLTIPPTGGQPPRFKRLQLSRSDLKDLFDGVITSLAAHSQWFSRRPQVQRAATVVIPLLIETLSDLDDGSLKPLLRSGRLPGVIAAVLASELIKPSSPPDSDKIVTGLTAVLEAVWAGGVNGAERLLEENVLLDLLSALANSGAAGKLFGGKQAEIAKVVGRLVPILDTLRRGQILAVDKMAADLKQAA